MPVIVDPDPDTVTGLLAQLPTGSQGVDSVDRMRAWLDRHADEYVVVLGPSLEVETCLAVCESLRTTRPTVSVVMARDKFDTDLLTSAMKAGARDVVETEDAESLGSAVARAHQLYVALRGPGGARSLGRVVTVFSPKGGVGKTTMSVNLALALNDGGAHRVCLVDLDLAFGDIAITMQLFPTHSIEHAIGAEDSIDAEMLSTLLTRHADSLMVLAAPAHPDTRERVSPLLINRIVHTLRESFDFVVIDTSPSFDEQVLTALDETDEVVIVTTLDVPTLKNVKVALETMDMLNVAIGHRHLLLNRADDAVGIGPDKVEAILGMPITAQVASSIDIAAATNAGRPIVVGSPEHASSRAILDLATAVAGTPIAAPASPAGSPAPATPGTPAPAAADSASKSRFRIRR